MLDFKMAKETNLSEFLSIEKECECGQKHVLSTKEAYAYDGAIEKVEDLLNTYCSLGKIGLISDENLGTISLEIAEKLGENRKISYVVLPELWRMTKKAIDQLPKLDEDCRVILSIGGGKVTSLGKILAKKMDIPQIAVITSLSFDTMFCAYTEIIDEFSIQTIETKSPVAVVVDTDIIKDNSEKLLADSFGVLASEIIAVFDTFVSEKFINVKHCSYLMDMINFEIKKGIEAFEKIIQKNGVGFTDLTDSLLKISVAKALIGKPLPSGVEETILAKGLQDKKEKKRSGLYGNEAFNAMIKLAKIYKLFYNSKLLGDELLPDMDKRADLLIEKFGINEETAQKLTSNMISPKSYLAIKQVLADNRRYFIDGIEEINSQLETLINMYLTILGEEKEDFDKDYKLAISLSPEIYNRFTTLTIMKFMGLLENV